MYRIALIEDDRIMRENATELLELSGYEVRSAEDGKKGVKLVQSYLPDLIICDIMMPEMDGYSVLHLLRKNKETASIPFIFLTAKTDKQDMRQGMNLGADDFLTKPFQDIELLNSVESRLEKLQMLKKQWSSIVENENSKGNQTAENHLSVDDFIEKYEPTKYNAHETIFRDGDHGHYLYYLEQGEVKTYRINSNGKELITAIYHSGDFFGYKPLLEQRAYHEYAETMQDSSIRKIPKDHFLDIVHHNLDISNEFINILSKKLSDKEGYLLDLAYSSVRKRIAHKLIELTNDSGNNETSISRTDLANLVGTSKETLVRTLSELKEQGVIKTEGMKIILCEPEKLSTEVQFW